MRKSYWIAGIALLAALNSAQAQIKGAGSSFAASLYGSWSQGGLKGSPVKLDYDPSSSSAGVKAAQDRSTDFGASDRPLSRAALDEAGLVQFPTAIGGIVIMANLPGIASDKIRFDGATLADLYTGRIKQWDDKALKALNPDLALPAIAVVPVFRSEGSGSSFVFTSFLSKQSAAFKTAVGVTSNFNVAGGKGVKTSSDAAKTVRATPGALAYFDYAFAIDLGLPLAQVKNQWGKFVSPNPESLQLAMRAADWEKMMIDQDPSFELDITDAACPGCWPIASATYVLVPLKGRNVNSARVLEFFELALQNGDEVAAKEGYVPLPSRAKNLVGLAMRRWYATLEKAGAGKTQRRTDDFISPALVVVAAR